MRLTQKTIHRLRDYRIALTLVLALSLIGVAVTKRPRVVKAAAFTAGNLVVVRVGDGAAALSNASTAVFLDEFTKGGGAVVQSIALPIADSGANQTLTMAGTATSEGFLIRSSDGRFLSLAGYDTAPGLASVATSTSVAVNRVVGLVDSSGIIDTTTRISDAFSAGNPRSAVTDDGTRFWATGSNSGVRFVTLGSAGTTTAINTTPTNLRVANIQPGYNGFPSPQLYISASSGTSQGVSTVGSGLPTTTGQTVTQLPGFPTAAGPSNYGFIFYDLTGVAGVDTLYVADDRTAVSGGGIQKWTYDGTTWTLAYTMNGGGTVGTRGLTGTIDSNGVPVLWATTTESSANRIIRVTDTGVGSTFTTIATASANTVYRGIAFAPNAAGGPTAGDATISGRIEDIAGNPISGAVVSLSGTQNRKTITDASGLYNFEGVETGGFYTVTPSSANFGFSPVEKSFSQTGEHTNAAFVGSVIANGNPLDTPEYFVRQHYLDFLGREPDEAGFNFWSDQILGCGNDAECIERRTINVSAAYFFSGEFQHTGGLVDRLYRATYGRNPLYAEFMPDTANLARNLVVGRSGWEGVLAANKATFMAGWVERASFRAAFDGYSNDAFVAQLITNTGTNFSSAERESLVSGLNGGTLSRADVVERIAANENFARARFNEAFVQLEYFGYLRRDPDPEGMQFWLGKLNQFEGNFERAEMVKSFITSGEYRARFSR